MSERAMSDEHGNRRKTDPKEEALNRALDTLEQMLDAKHEDQAQKPPPAEAAAGARGAEQPGAQGPDGLEPAGSRAVPDGQYAIPLLDNVVLPGTQAAAPDLVPDTGRAEQPEAPLPSIADDEDCQRLVQRLTSELEIIIQTGVEEALQKAGKQIGRQVKEHIDIMLPEILEEIGRMKDRNDQ